MTRKLVATLFCSVDGIVSAPHEFQLDSFDDGVAQAMGTSIGSVDDVLMGRVSYTEWAPYWPSATDPFADFINPVRKHIASRTLEADELTWQNSSLITEELGGFVDALKQSPGRDISVCGSISIVSQLVLSGQLDELTLVIHPVIAGQGRRLFDECPQTRLELLDSVTTEKGNAILTWGPRR